MATAFKIETGHPVPATAMGRPAVYPFREMAVGESFLVPDADRKMHQRVSNCAVSAAKRHGLKFTTRRESKGVRVWRVA